MGGDTTVPWSSSPTAVPCPAAPPTVVAGDRTLTVDWTAPEAGDAPVTSYTLFAWGREPGIYYRLAGSRVVRTSSDETRAVIRVRNGIQYDILVAATNAHGDSLFSYVSRSATTPTVPTITSLDPSGIFTFKQPTCTMSGSVTEDDGEPVDVGRVKVKWTDNRRTRVWGPVAVDDGRFSVTESRCNFPVGSQFYALYSGGTGAWPSDSDADRLWPRVRVALDIDVVERTVAGDERAKIEVGVHPRAVVAGHGVLLQLERAGGWRAVASDEVGERGRASFFVTPPRRPGDYRYRVFFPAVERWLSNSSIEVISRRRTA